MTAIASPGEDPGPRNGRAAGPERHGRRLVHRVRPRGCSGGIAERRDQGINVLVEPVVADLEGLPSRECHQVLRQLGGFGHRRISDEDRNHPDMPLERFRHFQSNEVVVSLETPAPLRVRRPKPRFSNDRDDDIAVGDRLIDPIGEILAGANRVDVDEHIVAAEVLPEPIGQATCVGSAVLATIVERVSWASLHLWPSGTVVPVMIKPAAARPRPSRVAFRTVVAPRGRGKTRGRS